MNKPYKDWTLAETKDFCEKRGPGREDYDPCDGCPLWPVLCAKEPYPGKWNLNGFTPAEVEAAKAVKVLFPNVVAVGAHGERLNLWQKDGTIELSGYRPRWDPFPSLRDVEKVELDDIIGL